MLTRGCHHTAQDLFPGRSDCPGYAVLHVLHSVSLQLYQCNVNVFSIFKKVLKDQRFGMGEIQVSGAAGILAALQVLWGGDPLADIECIFYCCTAWYRVKAVCGSYSTDALRHIVLLAELVPSFISRGAAHTKQRDRPLLVKEGTIPGI